VRQFWRNEDAAVLIEHTLLISILILAAIVMITAVGAAITGRWAVLFAVLPW
jgi:Flp pilus assembly pilin Flp